MASQLDTISVRDHLTSIGDREYQFPVHFAYDYLHGGVNYLMRPWLQLNEQFQNEFFLIQAARTENQGSEIAKRSDNAIDLYPLASGLPWACGILTCRQSRHWKLSLDTASSWVKDFATANDDQIPSRSGCSIASIAQKEVSLQFEEGWAKFPVYLFSEGDEQRTRLLAIVNVFIFLFDDFWEMHDIALFSGVQKAFTSRMQPGANCNDRPRSSLESKIDETIAEILELDRKHGNNAGEEMIELMIRFFSRPGPPKEYKNMEEFLLYRHEDAAVPYVLGCVKFSLNSSVDLNSPSLANYIRLFKDHVSIANDLGSWEKEKRAYDTGKVLYLINAVEVTKQLLSLSTYNEAVAITQGLQFEIECKIDKEVQRLVAEDCLTAEEWQLVDATLPVMSGNVLVSTIMSRYGGQNTRLQ